MSDKRTGKKLKKLAVAKIEPTDSPPVAVREPTRQQPLKRQPKR